VADFNDVVSRRKFLQGSFALGSGAFIAATIGPAKATSFLSGFNGISFNPVPANGKDTITLASSTFFLYALGQAPIFKNILAGAFSCSG